ncbi:MAG: 7-cyano-7-deazaguanine synthase [Romboutsia timonensis]
MKKVLLYSGGTDSWLIDKIAKPDVKLYFDIGTDSCKGEIKRLGKDVIIDKTLSGLSELEKKDGSFIVPLRNLYFIARATSYGDHIILGTNKTDAHNDKTLEFAEKTQDLLNYYYGPSKDGLSEIKDIVVDFSYKKYDKADLVRIYLENGGTVEEYLNESFSCYTPVEKENGEIVECHNCKPCFNKMMALYRNNVEFPKGYLHDFIPFLENKVEEYKNGKPHRYYTLEELEGALELARKDV